MLTSLVQHELNIFQCAYGTCVNAANENLLIKQNEPKLTVC